MSHLLIVVAFLLGAQVTHAADDLASHVDPFIGTGGHGHTFPGATTPFGMVQLSPDTRIDGSWDGCSGYHHSDNFIYGFSHTHLSGTGCSDWGDVMLMPYLGAEPTWQPEEYGSRFSHKREAASPGYYQVTLDDDDIDVELTVTPRAGLHRYTFNRAGRAHVILDLNHRDKLLDGEIKIEPGKRVTGFRRSEAWAKDQWVYFAIEFSKPPVETSQRPGTEGRYGSDLNLATDFAFDVAKGEQLLIKVALSPTGAQDAADILGARAQGRPQAVELLDWDFERVRDEARAGWNEELSRIEVDGGTAAQRQIFYTALYHCMIHPSLATDSFGAYRGMDGEFYKANDFTYYTVFSLWDTFRALHPLLSIIDPDRTRDFVQTMMWQYRIGGRLPVWELSSNETNTMIGYHAVPVIANAYLHGTQAVDQEVALEAMKMSATEDTPGLNAYRRNGVITVDDDAESVSKTLEYAYDDYCIMRQAAYATHRRDVSVFGARAASWRHLFDPATGFVRPRQNGGWLTPFDPRQVNNHFTEANAWQYTFFAPHDVPWMVQAMGGRGAFERKLDELFSADSETTGRTQADITGMIGQYAHGNEPSHHVAYLYNAAGTPWKTQDRVRQIMTELYTTGPAGLCGNEDCGQMSAWFVWSAMGLYPVDPVSGHLQIGWPMFDEVRIHLADQKTFTIRADRKSAKDRYIQRVTHNDLPIKRAYVEGISAGGALTFEMGRERTCWYDPDHRLATFVGGMGDSFVPLPTVRDNRRTFRESLTVDFEPIPDATIHVTRDGSTPTTASPVFERPFVITESATIQAIAVAPRGMTSHVNTSRYHKIPNDWTIDIDASYNRQYTAGGDDGIINGLRGDLEWRKGGWQGYQDQDFEAVVDLQRNVEIKHLAAGFLQDTRSWILMPTAVMFAVSQDGKRFEDVLTVDNAVAADDYTVQIQDLGGDIAPQQARYVRVRAKNFGALPAWHLGAGGEAFIFVDEITIR